MGIPESTSLVILGVAIVAATLPGLRRVATAGELFVDPERMQQVGSANG